MGDGYDDYECVQNNEFSTISVAFYILFALYYFSYLMLCCRCCTKIEIQRRKNFDEESFIFRYWQIKGTGNVWNDIITDYYDIQYFGRKHYRKHAINYTAFVSIFGIA